jgi:hypothetical protein
MPRTYPDPDWKVVRNAAWDYAADQAKKGAICKGCKKWHLAADGRAESGPCPAIYVRYRKVAILIVGIPNTRAGHVGGERQEPGQRDINRCLAAAIADHGS